MTKIKTGRKTYNNLSSIFVTQNAKLLCEQITSLNFLKFNDLENESDL